MLRKFTSALICFFFIFGGFAQIPAGYYNAAASKTGETLRSALRDIVTSGSVKLPYTSSSFDVWDAYSVTDSRPGNHNQIWDMYSDVPGGSPSYTYTIFTNQCGTSGAEGDCYSREHQVPNSWWGGFDDANNPQYTDLHHLPPADQYVNSRKSAHPIGQTSSASWISTNGSKVGPCSWPGYSGTVFEPIDEYKGDFARAYLYMATRYKNVLSSWVNNYSGTEAQYVINDSSNNYKQWFIDMLVRWTINDPVSQKEIDRNNAIYYNTPQHNRNPYIDHPEYVCIVWSSTSCSSGPQIAAVIQNPLFPNSLNTVSVSASVNSTVAISTVYLVYGFDGSSFQDTIPMNFSTGVTYITSASLPAFAAGTAVYYKIIAVDNLSNTGTSSINSYSVLKGEPAAYPAGFACGNISGSTISLTWVDANGGSVPDGYLVKTSNVSLAAISDPVDGIAEPDGSFLKNISQGIQGVTFSGLSSAAPYYFKIYPYSNSGTNINYKTSATPPNTVCTTSASPGGGCAPDLIISEYVEGSSSNKYIEIANYTGSTVSLSNYRLRLFSNGSATATSDILLSGTLNNQATVVYRNSAATIYTGASTTSGAVNFNGDDAFGLFKISSGSYVDIFGRIGEDPGTTWSAGSNTTLDKTLVRNASVTSGVIANPSAGFPTLATEWTQYNQDVIGNLGDHTMSCSFCASPTIQTSIINFSSVGASSMTINWTNGNGSNRIVVMKQGSTVTGTPLNNTTYTANSVFGSGITLNTGEYIVYNNTGSSVTVSNLVSGQSYYISVFEYNCVPGSEIYLVPGTAASRQTYSIVTGTVPESQYCVTGISGYTTTIDFVSTGTFSNNTYTAELSDAIGSFENHDIIGSIASNLNAETITITIPANKASGTGYRIRVISNGPAISGSSSNAFEIILSSTAQAPVSVISDRSGFCSDDAGTINLSATGGSGTVLSWFSTTCGGSFVGSGNPLIIASPTETTTYYARWGTSCSNSTCASVTVSVAGLSLASAGPAINSCSGVTPIVMTGASATGTANIWSGGTGMGTWIQHSDPALATFIPAVSGGSFIATLTVTGTGSCPGATAVSTRIISWGTTGTWTGAVSTNWFTSGNWCGGVPTSTTSIIIPPASQLLFSPTIGASNARCLNITLSGSISIANGYNLDVYGNWINSGGSLSGTNGFVTLRGTSKSISGTTGTAFPAIIIGTGASYSLSNNNSCMSLTYSQGSTSSLTLNGSSLSVNGNVTISNPSFSGTNALNINNGFVTVTGNVTVGSGTSQGARVARIFVSSGSLTIGGNLVYNTGNVSSGIVDLSGGTATLNIAGNITLNTAGTLSPGTSSTVNYNGSLAAQNITFGSGISYYNLSLNNSSTSGVSLVSSVSTSNVTGNINVQSGIFSNGGFSITGNASRQFAVANAAIFRLSGNTSMPTGFGSVNLGVSSTVDFRGTQSQTIGAFNYGNLNSSSTGARVLASSGTIGVSGVFTPGTNSYTISGSTISFNGMNQAVPPFNGTTGYNNLSIAQLTGNAITGGNITVGGTLNLISGNFNLDNRVLTLTGTAAIAGIPFSATKMIVADGGGELRKNFTGNASYLFPVGDNTGSAEYSPVTITYTSGTYAGGAYVAVKLSNAKHPANASNIDYISRFWSISNGGISNPVYSIEAGYVAADITGSEANISMGKYIGSLPWIKYSSANSGLKTLTASNVSNTGTIHFTGIPSPGPEISIAGGTTICNGNSVQLSATVIGTAPFSYSWSPVTGLSNAGIADPVANPVSNTNYTLTVTDANGFSAIAGTTVNVSTPVASITASGNVSFCQGGSVILTSSSGSSYFWSNGGNTSIIAVSTSGNYSVTVTNSFGCTATAAPVTVTVNPLPVVSFTGLATNFCTTDALVTLTGTPAGGIFSGPGISGNSFTPSAAGAGTHNIVYLYTDVNGCSNSISQNVMVNTCATIATLNLTAFLEGFYSGNNTMRANIYDLGISTDPAETDTVTVNLWAPINLSNSSPDYSAKTVLHTDGTATLQYPAAVNGNSLYIAVKHRNHVETWSKLPVTFSSNTGYNFTDNLQKAYGDGVNPPMSSVAGGKFAFYGGDVNQDGTVDGSDANDIEIGANNFNYGYNTADANGDGETGGQDANIVEINANLFLFYARPY